LKREKEKMTLEELADKKVLILDGAMGTMIQRYDLQESDYRGSRFKDWASPLQGNNDLISITQPDILKAIHKAYLEGGADLLETNTFNSNAISMADYHMEDLVVELNAEAVRIAKEAIAEYQLETENRPAFVVGSIGPTNRTASISPDVNQPGYRAVGFDDLELIYYEQALALIEAGADALMVETVFDTLNAKAALSAIYRAFDKSETTIPVMISGTITDASGRTLSGQTAEAFLISVSHFPLFSIGFNCALGADQLLPYVQELSRKSDFRISAHPNAGLPNAFGQYDQGPEEMTALIKPFLELGVVDILGGCCGTSPEHILSIKKCADEIGKKRSLKNEIDSAI